MEKHRTGASVILIAIGAALLLYGLSLRAEVAAPSDEQSQIQGQVLVEVPSTPEPPAAQGTVAKDEVKQGEPSQVKPPAKEATKVPATCPT
ncbi:MAG TPA: hypothetical protein PKH24_17970 [Sedimentisphaerales bacterium]|jgi:hypothetical protein|nr:hypothetical protein [Sedimentisphaerales bacterium]HNU30917.1 hypothetical protein [Sedimentisphaerales bacterium]